MHPGDLTIGSGTYRLGKLDTFAQMDIARRFSQALIWTARAKQERPDLTRKDLAKVLLLSAAPIAQADMDFVTGKCLSVVSRVDDKGMVFPLREPTTGALMYKDTPFSDLLEIVVAVADAHGLIDFFSDPPSALPAPGAVGSQSS